MKKITLLLFAVLAVLGTVFFSCEKDLVNDLQNDSNGKSVLFSNLDEFNKNYLIENEKKQPKESNRGFWKFMKRAVTIAGADIVGAGAGLAAGKEIIAVAGMTTGGSGAVFVATACATVAGGGASIVAYDETKEAQIMHQVYLSPYNIIYPANFNYLSNVGKNHNKEVFAALNNYDSLSYIYSLSENERRVFETSQWNSFTLKLNNYIVNYTSTSEIQRLISSLHSAGMITSNMKEVYDLFFEVFIQIKSDENVEDIVNFYIDEISDDTLLTLVEKEALIASFSVASESIYLWLSQLNNYE